MAHQSNFEGFKKQLLDHYDFPAEYLFKFIVPVEKENDFKVLFPDIEFDVRNSKTGKYLSFSKKVEVKSSEEVIEVYKKAYSVEGIISL